MCYAVCIDRYGDIVGTVKSEKYICYSKITVNAFKRDLIDKTLRNLIKMIEAEIRKDILHHVKSSFEISIKDKAQLDNLPNDLNAEFSFIRDSFLSISWPIDEVSMAYLFITWLMPIDVNSTSWRTGVANEISEQIHAKKSTIINGMASKIREMCNHTTEDLGNTILQLEKCIESAKMTVKHERKYKTTVKTQQHSFKEKKSDESECTQFNTYIFFSGQGVDEIIVDLEM